MAIARRLGAAGAKLIITASSNRIADRIEELRLEGFEVEGRPTDLTDESQVREFSLWAESVWGRVDILVNNAGMAMQGKP
jgi:3-oxoacyl-[acyl-carrier protein] reductase